MTVNNCFVTFKTAFLICCSLVLTGFVAAAQDYVITDFGAKGDNVSDNTTAIQQAIDKAALKGGTIVVPEGIFITGTIKLKSNTTLHLNRNSVIKGIGKSESYPSQTISYPFESKSAQWGNALIYAGDAENVAITGEGTIDGNGADTMFYYYEGMTTHVRRPFVLLMSSCRNVTISGVTMINSAQWMQRYIGCDFLRINGIKVFNHVRPNNDGLDIDDCHNVVVSDCIIDADDDALCFKSEGSRGVKHAVVTNCILSSHASAFKMGTGSCGGFQSIQFSNTVIRPSKATNLVHIFKQKGGLTGIDLASVDGGILKDVNISNITIDSVQNPIFVKLGNRLSRKVKGEAGIVEDIHFSQITVKYAGAYACAVTGFPDHYVRNISFRDIFIEHQGGGNAADTSLNVSESSDAYPGYKMFKKRLPASGFYVRHAKNIQFNNVQLRLMSEDIRPAIVCDDVKDLEIEKLKYTHANGTAAGSLLLANTSEGIIQVQAGDEQRVQTINSMIKNK